MNDTSKRTQIEFIDIFPSSIFLSYHSKRHRGQSEFAD